MIENIFTEEQYKLLKGLPVTTDSRAIKGGEIFFAIKGENFDGNDYALSALEKGAAWAVVNEGTEAAASGDARVIAVSDTLEALKALAHRHRCEAEVNGKRLTILGLTGTNGKTTTKELISAVLRTKYEITATQGNLNNDIGVPLTLMQINDRTELAVIEMGANHPDDIKHLVEVVEPDFGLITNVGKAHLLGFGSFEGVKKAKGQLYDWIKEHGGKIFLNIDDRNLLGMAAKRLVEFIPYGINDSGATVLPSTAEDPYLRIQIDEEVISTQLVGAYNATNVLAALAVGEFFGVDHYKAVEAIENYEPKNNRSQMTRTERNLLIVDAYNANPSSMAAALDNFALVQAEEKIALLGDMRELGEDSVSEHVNVVKKIEASDYKAILVGDEFRKALDSAGTPANVIGWFATSDELASRLEAEPVSGATLLIKGSRGIQMEKAICKL